MDVDPSEVHGDHRLGRAELRPEELGHVESDLRLVELHEAPHGLVRAERAERPVTERWIEQKRGQRSLEDDR